MVQPPGQTPAGAPGAAPATPNPAGAPPVVPPGAPAPVVLPNLNPNQLPPIPHAHAHGLQQHHHAPQQHVHQNAPQAAPSAPQAGNPLEAQLAQQMMQANQQAFAAQMGRVGLVDAFTAQALQMQAQGGFRVIGGGNVNNDVQIAVAQQRITAAECEISNVRSELGDARVARDDLKDKITDVAASVVAGDTAGDKELSAFKVRSYLVFCTWSGCLTAIIAILAVIGHYSGVVDQKDNLIARTAIEVKVDGNTAEIVRAEKRAKTHADGLDTKQRADDKVVHAAMDTAIKSASDLAVANAATIKARARNARAYAKAQAEERKKIEEDLKARADRFREHARKTRQALRDAKGDRDSIKQHVNRIGGR